MQRGVMQWLDLIHRWTGGVLGLVLAIMGLTGRTTAPSPRRRRS